MNSLTALIDHNVNSHYQNYRFMWWPLDVRMTGKLRYGTMRLPGDLILSFGLEADYDERTVCEVGPFVVTRPETSEEREEREQGWAEEAYMERELNRYTEWYY